MKKISLRLPDATFEKIEMHRGDKTISDYIRSLIEDHHDIAKRESSAFQMLFNDVSFIKESLNTSSRNITTRNELLSLALFIVEVLSVANPSAYANQKEKLQDIYNKLKGDFEHER